MVSDCTSIAGKVAVVTGASGGIGKAIAITLAKEGVKCALGARRQNMLDEVVKEITGNGGTAIGVQTDVTSRDQVKNLVAKAEEAFGGVDILVNNAAACYFTLMKNLKEDAWENTIDTNCKGVMFGIGAVLDGMIKRRSGHIINISSDSGRRPDPGLAAYCGTKFFMEGMSQTLRQEVSGFGVKVTCIQPGFVETSAIHQDFEPETAAKIMTLDPDMEILQVGDIANAVTYVLKQPKRVAVNEVLIQPRGQDSMDK